MLKKIDFIQNAGLSPSDKQETLLTKRMKEFAKELKT